MVSLFGILFFYLAIGLLAWWFWYTSEHKNLLSGLESSAYSANFSGIFGILTYNEMQRRTEAMRRQGHIIQTHTSGSFLRKKIAINGDVDAVLILYVWAKTKLNTSF